MIQQFPEEVHIRRIQQSIEDIVQELEDSTEWTYQESVIHSQLSILVINIPGFGGTGTTSLRGRLLALGSRRIQPKKG